jgi:hypothetical protein
LAFVATDGNFAKSQTDLIRIGIGAYAVDWITATNSSKRWSLVQRQRGYSPRIQALPRILLGTMYGPERGMA